MGWVLMLALAAITGGALWRFARFPVGGAQLLGSALLIALAGYAWQGDPALPSRPTRPAARENRPDDDFARLRGPMFERFSGDAQVLATADAFRRQGLDDYAVGVLRSALVRRPRSAELWVGLGSALIGHADGQLTPAAELAFQRAAAASPLHPGPPYFLGLAYARAGRLAEARDHWGPLLARTPADAPWRMDLTGKVAALDRVMQ